MQNLQGLQGVEQRRTKPNVLQIRRPFDNKQRIIDAWKKRKQIRRPPGNKQSIIDAWKKRKQKQPVPMPSQDIQPREPIGPWGMMPRRKLIK